MRQPDSSVPHHPLRSGSLLASLGKQVRTVTVISKGLVEDISKGLVEDLTGLVDEKPDGPDGREGTAAPQSRRELSGAA